MTDPATAAPPSPLARVGPADVVREGLTAAAEHLRALGVPVPQPSGKLLRPFVAYALVPAPLRASLDERFWFGALAVQMVHEASLVHDDILDDAGERRGAPTLVAERGLGAALVIGDHILTGAYRAAAMTGSPAFLEGFVVAVERTVAGEALQGRSVGQRLDPRTYEVIVRGKSGELFGAAAILGGAVLGLGRLDERAELGIELGALYQRVDDLLDYCPGAATGKPPLQDFRQRKWTWVLDLADVGGFETMDPDQLLDRLLLAGDGGPSPARRALVRLREEQAELVARAASLSPGDRLVGEVLDGWVRAAERGVREQERSRTRAVIGAATPRADSEVRELAGRVGGSDAWAAYFGRHAKTFRLASRLFPRDEARIVAGVYAFCRFTDDLVDAPHDGAGPDVVRARLDAWQAWTERALAGERTGIPILDDVVAEAVRAGVDAEYPRALLSGVRMDLERTEYRDVAALERYTFGVAASVGGWVTQRFGMHDAELLEHAHALGHAMQLTNIVRDVGEDLDRGRLYIPLDLLEAHGLSRVRLQGVRHGAGPVPDAYVSVLEDVMALADARYEQAWAGIHRLPGWYRRPVAVAAEAYRAIHGEVRRNGHDTLRRRARTSLRTKLGRGSHGLVRALGPTP